MNEKEFISWLEKEKLVQIAKNNFVPFKKALQRCLNARREDILIICDGGYPEKRIAPVMGLSYYYAAKKLGLKTRIIIQAPKLRGDDASKETVDALMDLRENSMVVLCLTHRLGKMKGLGRSFRKFAVMHNHRFISSPSLGSINTEFFSYFVRSIDTDFEGLQKRAAILKQAIDSAKEVHVSTEKGTDLVVGIRGRSSISNDGDYKEPGTGGNLPAGEVYIAPRKRKVEGRIVVDATVTHHWGTSAARRPVVIDVERGQVTQIKGGIEAQFLNKSLELAYAKAKYPWGLKYLSELGIGINKDAQLIGATIIDEKVLGTAHVAIGSNYWFGGSIKAIIHLDQVFKGAQISLDGQLFKRYLND